MNTKFRRYGYSCLGLMLCFFSMVANADELLNPTAKENLCIETFETGIQTHDAKGVVDFSYNSQLIGLEPGLINTPMIKYSPWSSKVNCDTQFCQIANSPPLLMSSPVLPEFPFLSTNSEESLYISFGQVEQIGENNKTDYSKINLQSEATAIFMPADEYKVSKLIVGNNSTLILSPGDYWIDELLLGSSSKIMVSGSASVRMYVKSPLNVAYQVKVNVDKDGNVANPGKFFLYNFSSLTLNSKAIISGHVYSQGAAKLDWKASIKGSLNASNITLNSEAIVQFDKSSLYRLDFGSYICDKDNDGIYDGFDQDSDNDGYIDDVELLIGTDPLDATSTPPDIDGDFIPDSLDADKDGDGVNNDVDVFPSDKTEWVDLDGDGTGDNSDLDIDGDGFNNDIETQLGTNPKDKTSTPPDMDGDFIPDSLDADKDGDDVNNDVDVFPSDKTEWADLDKDGTGDNSDLDIDGDSFSNDIETQLGTNPKDKTSTPPDMDGDFIPDSLDADKDGDGVSNDVDVFPADKNEWADLDGDGTGDNSDLDIDGDGFNNDIETQLGTNPKDTTSTPPDMDGDFIPDLLDADKDGDGVDNELDIFPSDKNEWADLDADGTGDNSDLDIDGDGFNNDIETQLGTSPQDKTSTPPDMDGDFIPDSLDADKDGDGVNNDVDIFPSDKTEWTDLDADGTGDNSDLDIDGDGFNNDIETQLGTDPKDVTSTPPDMDGDFIPDSLDNDKDGDGVNNDVDSFPTDKTEWSDLDNDGTGDNSDLDIDGDGIDNETEIAQGSDPNDKDSFPITTPPKLTLDGPNTLVTTSAEIMMSGTVYVENGTVSVAAISDHFPATPLATDISNGRWTVTVPLLEGANNIQLLATNSGGLQSNINVKVTYQNSTNVAAIDITSPMANSTVSDNTIILRGILSSELLADAMQLTIRSLNTVEQDKSNTVEQDKFISVETTLQKTSSATQFSFTSHPISLLQGLNKIELLAQIDDQTITRDFYITYYPEQIEMAPPEISIISPETGSLLDARSFSLVADIYAQAGIHSITLDGIEVASITAKTFDHRLQELITIESGQSNISLTLAVTDTQQQVTTKTIDLQLDTLAPIIILDKPLLQDPLVNQLNEALYTVSGTVTELNLASFMIQDQSVTLQPVSEGQYRFEQVVSLPAGEALTLTLQATDRATNTDIQSYSLQLDAQVALSFVLPAENSRLISHGTPLTLQTVLRVGQVISDTQLLLQVLNSAGEEVFQQLLAITETLINSDLILPASKGKYQIVATVKDSANSELVVARRSVEVLEAQAIALQLVNASPAENSSDSAANGFISLQFNKPIELQKLQLKVNETAHGKTYMDLDPLGSDVLSGKGYQLVSVNRAFEPVTGALSAIKGDQLFTFYPDNEWAYDAEIFVTVIYDGVELNRYQFKTQALPTFVSGSLSDQLSQPIVGVQVTIPQLGLYTTTNRDGAYTFNDQHNALPTGLYDIVFNAGMTNLDYGEKRSQVSIKQGRNVSLGITRLALINSEVPFTFLSGNKPLSLLQGALKVDLSEASLLFPNGDNSGNAHFQFDKLHEITVPIEPLVMPHWMYSAQPMGIEIMGTHQIEMQIPELNGSYAHVPESGYYVLLLGLDKQSGRITPKGVGIIEGHKVRSVGSPEFEVMDYFGYGLLPQQAQPVIATYLEENWTIRRLLSEFSGMGANE